MKAALKNGHGAIAGIAVFALLLVLLLLAGAGYWYWWQTSGRPPVISTSSTTEPTGTPVTTPTEEQIADPSLGTQILVRTQNVVSERFPETNPLKRIRTNPF